jgi:probable rRNA maturation factor
MPHILDLQNASDSNKVPVPELFQYWVDTTLNNQQLTDKEVTIRVVDDSESQELNASYRNKDKPTNVLSFPFECPPEVPLPLIGDLVICAPVVAREAKEQNKSCEHHWAHMVIHGLLHLLGFDHIEEQQAMEMESIEVQILSKLKIDDPY